LVNWKNNVKEKWKRSELCNAFLTFYNKYGWFNPAKLSIPDRQRFLMVADSTKAK
jgi:hypothetical protein